MTHDELIAEGLVSLDEAMKFLSISRPTLNRLLDQGVLPTVRLVATRRIPGYGNDSRQNGPLAPRAPHTNAVARVGSMPGRKSSV